MRMTNAKRRSIAHQLKELVPAVQVAKANFEKAKKDMDALLEEALRHWYNKRYTEKDREYLQNGDFREITTAKTHIHVSAARIWGDLLDDKKRDFSPQQYTGSLSIELPNFKSNNSLDCYEDRHLDRFLPDYAEPIREEIRRLSGAFEKYMKINNEYFKKFHSILVTCTTMKKFFDLMPEAEKLLVLEPEDKVITTALVPVSEIEAARNILKSMAKEPTCEK